MLRYIDLSIKNVSLQNEMEYTLTISITTTSVSLNLSSTSFSNSTRAEWGADPVSLFAEQPQTVVNIGGIPESPEDDYFIGCMSRMTIDDIDIPLSGLLMASTEDGGFLVEQRDAVENFCNFCDLSPCLQDRTCSYSVSTGVECRCKESMELAADNQTCVKPTDREGLSPAPQEFPVMYVGIGAAAGVLAVLVLVVICLACMCKRREKNKRLYPINSRTCSSNGTANGMMSNGYSQPPNGYARPSNNYTPTIPKRRPSLTNANCVDGREQETSLNAVTSVDDSGESGVADNSCCSSPVRHNNLRVSHATASVESVTKGEDTTGGGGSGGGTGRGSGGGNGIPQMDDSGHEVNSTDSARTSSFESEDMSAAAITTSPYHHHHHHHQGNKTAHHPVLSLRNLEHVSSPEELSHGSSHHTNTQRTPLTPKEKKVIIPLRPESSNLSQSEFDYAVTTDVETESYRVSSSSGIGDSMRNQGRGSDSETSKISDCSTPQWLYKIPNSTRQYYTPHSHPPHFKQQQPGLAPPPAPPPSAPAHNPPQYFSPPPLPEHVMKASYPRGRSKSLHDSPLTKTPPSLRVYDTNYSSGGEITPQNRRVYFQQSSEKHPYNRNNSSGNSIIIAQQQQQQQQQPGPLNEQQVSDHDLTPTSFTRQYSDPRIPQNGNYCIPRKHHAPPPYPHHLYHHHVPLHSRQMSDPLGNDSSQQTTQDSILLVVPKSSHSLRHINGSVLPPGGSPSSSTRSNVSGGGANAQGKRNPQYYHNSVDRMVHKNQQHPNYCHHNHHHQLQPPNRSFSSGDTTPAAAPPNNGNSKESYHTLESLSKIDPISVWVAQDRMKIAVDQLDSYHHLLSGPCIPFEDVSTEPSIIESQLTMDGSLIGGEHHQVVFESQGGGEGTADMLDPLDMRMVRLQEDEIDSLLTDSEMGRQEMNHFPSADCSTQYTTTLVAGSTSTSGESTPKLQSVFTLPPSLQSFDV